MDTALRYLIEGRLIGFEREVLFPRKYRSPELPDHQVPTAKYLASGLSSPLSMRGFPDDLGDIEVRLDSYVAAFENAHSTPQVPLCGVGTPGVWHYLVRGDLRSKIGASRFTYATLSELEAIDPQTVIESRRDLNGRQWSIRLRDNYSSALPEIVSTLRHAVQEYGDSGEGRIIAGFYQP